MAVAILIITRRRKTVMHGGFLIISVPPRPFGSGNGDHALPYRYPLSLGTPIEFEIEIFYSNTGKPAGVSGPPLLLCHT
jgi:hypothetical protein